jgi:hypothetical protein
MSFDEEPDYEAARAASDEDGDAPPKGSAKPARKPRAKPSSADEFSSRCLDFSWIDSSMTRRDIYCRSDSKWVWCLYCLTQLSGSKKSNLTVHSNGAGHAKMKVRFEKKASQQFTIEDAFRGPDADAAASAAQVAATKRQQDVRLRQALLAKFMSFGIPKSKMGDVYSRDMMAIVNHLSEHDRAGMGTAGTISRDLSDAHQQVTDLARKKLRGINRVDSDRRLHVAVYRPQQDVHRAGGLFPAAEAHSPHCPVWGRDLGLR